MTNTDPDALMTTRDAARHWGIDATTVRWYVRKADPPLRPYKTVGRGYLFRRADVLTYERPPRAGWGRTRQPHDRTPRRYGIRFAHIGVGAHPPTPPPDPVYVDVWALIAAYGRGERDLEATTQAVLARVREA